MRKKILAGLAVLVVMFGLAKMANASLIEKDYAQGSGDKMLTYDSVTGLEWLNVTATTSITKEQVAAGYNGFMNDGHFRYATGAEIQALLGSIGIDTTFGGSDAFKAPLSALQSLLGVTYYGSNYMGSFYWTYGQSEAEWILLQVGNQSGQGGVVQFMSQPSDYGPLGNYLVREASPVPEPGTMLLLGTGLVGFIGARRKKVV